jgi:hypothetical protein
MSGQNFKMAIVFLIGLDRGSIDIPMIFALLRSKIALLAIVGLSMTTSSAWANGVIGSSVTGSLTFNGGVVNYFDPSNGFVPSSYLNTSGTTVTIASPAVEFGFQDGSNTDSANFTSATLVVEDVVIDGGGPNVPFTMTFTDTAFSDLTASGMTLSLVQDNFPTPVAYSLTGDQLTINVPGDVAAANDDFTAVFVVEDAPEPTIWAMFLLGLSAVGFIGRRKLA